MFLKKNRFNFLKQEFPEIITASEEMWTSVAGRILVCLDAVLEINLILFLFSITM